MKKSIVFGIGLVILVVGLIFLFVRDRNEYLEVHVLRTGFRGEIENTILRDYKEFIRYFEELKSRRGSSNREYEQNIDEIKEKYSEEFFIDKSLAVISVPVGSFGVSVRNERALLQGEDLKIRFELYDFAEVSVQLMTGFTILVEVSEGVKDIVIEVDTRGFI